VDPNAGLSKEEAEARREREEAKRRAEEERRRAAAPPSAPAGERNEREARNDRALERALPLEGPGGAGRAGAGARRWGDLPEKFVAPVLEAKRREPPQAYRKAIEDYLRRLAESRR
jgi:hypothetical protein